MALDLNDPEVKAALADAVAEQLATETAKLTKKVGELVSENRKLKAKGDVSPEDHQRLQQAHDDLEEKLNKANADLKGATTKVATLEKDVQSKEGALKSTVLEAGLLSALTAAGVPAQFLKASSAMLRDGAEVVIENGVATAKIGGKPLADAVKAWAGSDEGKHFVEAPHNNGSGAKGSKKVDPTTPNPFADGDHYSVDEQTRLYKENPEQARAFAEAAGTPI